MTPDVVIVGAGPAGAALGGLLARQGVRVLLLDRAAFPRAKPCGECLNPGAVAALHRLGLWEAAAPLAPLPLRGWRLQAGRRGRDLDFPGEHRALAVDRERFDHRLLTWAAGQGADVMESVRVSDLLWEGDRVAGVVAGTRRVRAAFTVGADGLRSVVARRLGLLVRPGNGGSTSRIAFTAHWAGVDGLGERGELLIRGDLVCGIAPLGRGLANVVLVVPAAAARGFDPVAALGGWQGLAERFSGARPAGPTLATGPFDQPVRGVTAPGALLAGDAAGYLDPFTGQGIYRALRGAELAAPAILGALAGDDAALADYQQRLQAEFGPAVQRQRRLDALVRRPRLLALGLGALGLLPGAACRLAGLFGDCSYA